MACPTCDHTMRRLDNWFWCPRCGTVKPGHRPDAYPPWAVDRARAYLDNVEDGDPDAVAQSKRDLDEAVNLPANKG